MKKYLYWLLPMGWMGIIFYSSATPYEQQDIKPLMGSLIDFSFLEPFVGWISFTYNHSLVNVDVLGINGFIEFFIRKGAHVTVFFLLACFFYIAFRKSTDFRIEIRLLFSFLLTVIYAVLDELHQGMTPNRTPYAGDVMLDSIGALIAVFCIISINWFGKRRNSAHK
ncbi:VanZ family protein [Oceanobacillus sp. CF4.6]|uniref:VanZ family protein n=1 Tax=Oceanobacillus sp. CF4.6 TaxID=3373080 RepID=UPI003EE7963B